MDIMKYKIVKLKKSSHKYSEVGLEKESLGVVLKTQDAHAVIMFFSTFNQGDYLVISVNKEDLEFTDIVLPEKISSELENYIFNNADRIANKCSFDEIKVKEYDSVELVVEKDKYAKFGIHKGAKGVVAYNKATNNNVLVDFGVITEDFDGLLSVSVDDIMKI